MISGRSPVVGLDEQQGTDAALVGAKAAALARARHARLPVLAGFVVTAGAPNSAVLDDPAVRVAWERLSRHGSRPLVVRSSSPIEDGTRSSMAGVFTSVLDVGAATAFEDAVAEVRASADTTVVSLKSSAPMAVLVQPMLAAARGGVLFGADPVTGRRDRIMVAVVEGGPHRLVSGQDDGVMLSLGRRGRLVDGDRTALTRGTRRELARLARHAERLFGGPQDIEWATDAAGTLWLLQSRPITALAGRPTRRSTRFGPGPVAETFPAPLSPLEQDLWVDPLRRGLRRAVVLSGAANRARADASPVVTTVGGRVAADLDLLDPLPLRGWRRLDPRSRLRRLRAAWRVGRLRAALPALADDLLTRVDADLAAVPAVSGLSEQELLGLLHRLGDGLAAVHGHEVLAGTLLAHGQGGLTGAGVALRALAEGRAAGLADADVLARHPVVLALSPPRVGPAPTLPETPAVLPPAPPDTPVTAVVREALRLRVRWLQELGSRAAWELGQRLFDEPATVRMLSLVDLEVAVAGRREVVQGGFGSPEETGPPLPAVFRLAPDGTPVAEIRSVASGQTGVGAGGGRGRGVVSAADGAPVTGEILVVRTLDPALASRLPGLGGLVAETGSVLSHLAILARELGVPTVVGVPDAVARFAVGTTVVLDGATGEIRREPNTEEVVA